MGMPFVIRWSYYGALTTFLYVFAWKRYLILDEHLKFLNNQQGTKHPSSVTVLEDVARALRESGFDVSTFKDRGGAWCTPDKKLEW